MSKSLEKSKAFTFVWRIKKFLSCYHKNGESLRSPVFIAAALDETHWFLEIYPRGKQEKTNQYVSCFVQREDREMEVEEIDVNFEMELIRSDGESLGQSKSGRNIFTKGKGWGWNEFMEINKLKENLEHFNDNVLVFKCRMSLMAPEPASRCTAWTKIGVEYSSFKWNVTNVTSSSWTETQKFRCSESMQIKITLTASEDNVNIMILIIEEENLSSRSITCRLSLLDVKGAERISKKSDYFFLPDDENDTWQFPSFFTKNMLKTEECKYLKNDIFTLKCEFSISNGTILEEIDGYHHNDTINDSSCSIEDPVATLQEDFRRMYSEHIQTDVTLSADNQVFKAHKSILSARSPILAAMLKDDLLENIVGNVDIEDVDDNTLDTFLRFVYTGSVENMNYESASKLIIVGDKFQVSSLKEKCALFLISALNVENVCDVLVIADTIVHEELKDFCIDYITKNSHNIFPSDVWSGFVQNNANLAANIFKKLSLDYVFHKKSGK